MTAMGYAMLATKKLNQQSSDHQACRIASVVGVVNRRTGRKGAAMNIRAYHRQQRQLADAQTAWDNMSPPDDDDEGGDDEQEEE